MPELHKPCRRGVLLDRRSNRVGADVDDFQALRVGVPSAITATPEAYDGGTGRCAIASFA